MSKRSENMGSYLSAERIQASKNSMVHDKAENANLFYSVQTHQKNFKLPCECQQFVNISV